MTDSLGVQAVSLRQGTPLTPMQRSLWASQRRHATAPLQNMALLTHISGATDPQRLADAFETVVRASDLLRTRLVSDDGVAMVRIADDVTPSEIIDLSRDEVATWSRARARRPIDLFRHGYDSAIIRHGDGTVSWYLALHHTITDATSSLLVFNATAAAYRGEDLAIDSYYDWWRGLSPDARHERAERFWRARPPAPKVGRLYRAVGRPEPSSTRVSVPLDDHLTKAISARLAGELAMISDDLGWTTLLTTVAASYLHRLTGADRFAIGVPVHNRSDPTARTIIGPLMEVYPVDITVETGDTFRSLHRRVARAVMTTLRHARPGTAPSGADVEAVVNVIPRAGFDAFGDAPVSTTWVHAGSSDPNHLFRLQLTSYGDGLDLVLDLNAGAADESHCARAPGHVSSVLRSLVDDPDASIHGGPICEPGELDLLHRWGTGSDPGPRPDDVVAGLRAALHDRDDVVLEQDGSTMTGRELWRRVLGVASWLRQQGVGGGSSIDRVGIDMGRTTDAVIAIYAVLVAGGSYVPLDPSQPAERRRRLAERAGCTTVLSELPAVAVDATIEVDLSVPPDREAYLLFTSGSTGEPKGVPITRGGLARYLQFAQNSFAVPNDAPMVAPLFSALTFDLTVTTLFVPILSGGRVVVVPPDGPAGLAAMADRTDLTWCKATPSHLELLLRLRPNWDLRSLVVGGEAFLGRLARGLFDAFPNVRVFNEYGPTEAVVGCMIHEATPDSCAEIADVPIGRPAPGVHLRVVDAGLQVAPVGATGELLISHDGVTDGYLDADHATGDDSANDPFVAIDGRRWYRSGDVVRLTDLETLVYHGRIDEQVKVGGIRLEPTEVEEALTSHPAIARAAVRVWAPTLVAPSHHCVRCGLPSNVPGVGFDEAGVCETCHDYERINEQAAAYFRTLDDLAVIRDRARADRAGRHDCLHLISGGKDSTYALYQLVEMGFDVYAMTLDNGYISDGAKDNVRRSVAELGIEHEFVTSDVMDEIFRDSLERHSNVCNGCYKTLYTLATTRADQLGIPVVVTGLSRGQLFETRLIPQQFGTERFDPDAIDRAVIEARRSYHRVDDGPNRLLDTSVFDSDDVFDRISYVDFYRYVDIELSDMLSYLETSAPWVRPADTGRSTNCLINAAGIHNHLTEQGYHNYAIPYAWDVRLGHKTRQEAIDELDDDLDMASVDEMLRKVGHQPEPRQILTAWYELAVDATHPKPAELRTFLSGVLPTHAIPSAFVAVDEIEMTRNGKLDVASLPAPMRVHRPGPALHVSAESPLEATIVSIYERVLMLEPVGVTDDFFELGGDSLAALGLVVELSEELDRTVREELVFTNTTPRTLAEAIDSLADRDDRAVIVSRSAGVPPAISTLEQVMLFGHLSEPDDPKLNVGHLFRVHGVLDTGRLVRAIRSVVEVHAPLTWTYGEPRRRLSADDAIDVILRTGSIPVDELTSAVRRFHLQPFDLEDGPLGRCVVLPLDDATVGVLLVFHHITIDAGSVDRLWAQIDRAYSGLAPATLDIDYADHAAWQEARIADADLAPWLVEPFADAVEFAESGGSGRSGGGYLQRTASFTTDELRAGPGATPFATSLAALAAVLRDRSRGDRVGVGLTVSTREHAAADDMIGLFLNTIPVGVEVDPDATFQRVAAGASAAVTTALAARTIPLTRLVSARRRAGLPGVPVNVLLAFEDWVPCRLGAMHVDHEVLATGSPIADATFFVQVHGSRVELSIEHRNAVLDASAAARLLDDFDRTIREAIDRPLARVADRRAVDIDVGAVVSGRELVSDERLLHDLIGEQAVRDPFHPAVRLDDEVLTYGELDRRANRLAHELRGRGAGPGSFVGISAHRRPELIVAIVGVLKAGAAYVPIDPGYPADRIRHVVDDAGLTMIVASPDVELDSPAVDTIDLGVLDPDRWPDTRPDVEVSPDDLAYVIYTSGSTGLPKGVMVRHRNIVASTLARAGVYDRSVERFLLLSSFAFDSSMVGIFWTLCTGGTVVFPPTGFHDDVLRINELVEQRRISHLLALPSLYRLMVDEADERQLRSLETVIVAGEPCLFDVVERHRNRCGQAVLANEYGPTEGTVWSHVCLIDDTVVDDPVPIGSPIPGVMHVVLDESGGVAPEGEPGELYIGGAGVTAGYLGRADLTDERFVRLGARVAGGNAGLWYRTGDVVRTDERGRLLFIGRIDDQVKIRGFRIEPGEVEAGLRALPDVADAAVGTAIVGDRTQLTAWFVPRSPDAVTATATLRLQLAERLPEQLVPSWFVAIESMPLGANGKVDRSALPAPEPGPLDDRRQDVGADARDDGVEPDERERRLAMIWADALGVEHVSLDDNFFDLGGDSIISLQIVARARRAGIDLRPRQVFEHQTVRELAGVAATADRAVPAQGPVIGDVPLTPIQHWFFEQSFASPNHWNQTLELELSADTDVSVLLPALEHVQGHHDQLRARFDMTVDPPRQTIAVAPTPVVVEEVDLAGLPSGGLDQVVAGVESSLDIAAGRLVGVVVCREGAIPRRVVVTIHHLVVDGVSWSPIIEDWSTAYQAGLAGRRPDLPARSTSFRDWSTALADATERFVGADVSWAAAAAGADWASADDFELLGAPANSEREARSVTTSLDREQTAALLAVTAGHGRDGLTVEEVLVAAVAIVVPGHLGHARMAMMLEGHGREELVDPGADLSRTVGWFTSQFPVVLDVERPDDRARALDEVRSRLRQIPDRGVGFGIDRYLGQGGAPASSRLPVVAFNYLGQLDRTIRAAAPFSGVGELRGAIGADNRRTHLLGILTSIREERLTITIDHLPGHLGADAVAELLDELAAAVVAVTTSRAGTATASFDLIDPSDADAAQLSALLAQLDD